MSFGGSIGCNLKRLWMHILLNRFDKVRRSTNITPNWPFRHYRPCTLARGVKVQNRSHKNITPEIDEKGRERKSEREILFAKIWTDFHNHKYTIELSPRRPDPWLAFALAIRQTDRQWDPYFCMKSREWSRIALLVNSIQKSK